jgi:hypothetical protein
MEQAPPTTLFRGDAMEDQEGWYVDPYGVHDARWISAGTPTALVRDGGVEAQDPPPNTPYAGQLEALEETAPKDGNDLLRADDADTKSFDPDREEEAAWDVFGQSSGGD